MFRLMNIVSEAPAAPAPAEETVAEAEAPAAPVPAEETVAEVAAEETPPAEETTEPGIRRRRR